jgi:acyl carrier protein
LQLTHIEAIDPDIELTDQGLDSMSGTELVSQLENALGIDIGPDILFECPLKDQFVDEVFTLAGRLN